MKMNLNLIFQRLIASKIKNILCNITIRKSHMNIWRDVGRLFKFLYIYGGSVFTIKENQRGQVIPRLMQSSDDLMIS